MFGRDEKGAGEMFVRTVKTEEELESRKAQFAKIVSDYALREKALTEAIKLAAPGEAGQATIERASAYLAFLGTKADA